MSRVVWIAVATACAACKPAAVDRAPTASPEARVPDAIAADTWREPADQTLADARAAYDGRDFAGARALLEQLLQAEPRNAKALLLLAQVELELENTDAARSAAQRCLDVDPTVADCWLTIGVVADAGDDNDAAIPAYEAYLRHAPDGAYASRVRQQLERLRREQSSAP